MMSNVMHPIAEPGYWMSDEGQFRLVKARDQLRLLAALTRPRTPNDEKAVGPPLSYAELSHCFENLREQVDATLATLEWPARLEPSPARGRQPPAPCET